MRFDRFDRMRIALEAWGEINRFCLVTPRYASPAHFTEEGSRLERNEHRRLVVRAPLLRLVRIHHAGLVQRERPARALP